MIPFAKVAIGEGEGVRCTRCHGEAPTASYDPAEVVAERLLAVVEAWAGGPGPNVELGGAEPFRHPELPAIVAAAMRSGVRRLRLDTDAVALASSGNAAGSMSAGVRHISFSLLGGTAGVHHVLTGAPGALDATLEGVRAFRDVADREGVAVAIRAVIPACRHVLRDLPDTVGTAVKAGADEVAIRFDEGDGEIIAALPWITAACDTGVMNGVWVEVSGLPFCLLPGYELHVADVVRQREGAHVDACGACGLAGLCGGGPNGISARLAASLAPPAEADRLAAAVSRARSGEAPRG